MAVFDFFRILCLKESFLKFVISDCWSNLEIIFVSLTDSIEGSATPKQMNAMLIALRFLCNIFSHKIGQDFFNDGNIDGVFFFINGAMNKGGEKSPKIVNACSGFLYNLRTFYSGN